MVTVYVRNYEKQYYFCFMANDENDAMDAIDKIRGEVLKDDFEKRTIEFEVVKDELCQVKINDDLGCEMGVMESMEFYMEHNDGEIVNGELVKNY